MPQHTKKGPKSGNGKKGKSGSGESAGQEKPPSELKAAPPAMEETATGKRKHDPTSDGNDEMATPPKKKFVRKTNWSAKKGALHSGTKKYNPPRVDAIGHKCGTLILKPKRDDKELKCEVELFSKPVVELVDEDGLGFKDNTGVDGIVRFCDEKGKPLSSKPNGDYTWKGFAKLSLNGDEWTKVSSLNFKPSLSTNGTSTVQPLD